MFKETIKPQLKYWTRLQSIQLILNPSSQPTQPKHHAAGKLQYWPWNRHTQHSGWPFCVTPKNDMLSSLEHPCYTKRHQWPKTEKMRLSLLYPWLSTQILNFNFFFKTYNELLPLKGLNSFWPCSASPNLNTVLNNLYRMKRAAQICQLAILSTDWTWLNLHTLLTCDYTFCKKRTSQKKPYWCRLATLSK